MWTLPIFKMAYSEIKLKIFMMSGEQIRIICGRNYGYNSGKKKCSHGNSFSLGLKLKENHPSQKPK